MPWRSIALGASGLILLSCLPALARDSHDMHGGNCVAYARELTGVHLDGNAAAWWPHAEGRYERGQKPEVGAILVFKPYEGMRVGHVAVVSQVVSAREVLVDQANWVRGRVTKAMSVIDASPLNDWTSVKVQYGGTHGRENPTYGFIYPHTLPANFGEAIAAAEPDTPRAAHADRVTAPAGRHEKAPVEEMAASRHAAPRRIAERPGSRKNADVQVAVAQDSAPRQITEHPAHHRTRPAQDDAKAAPSRQPAPQLAAAAPAHRKHKDAQVAYVRF